MTENSKVTKQSAGTPGPWELEYDDGDCAGTFTLGMATYLDNPGCYSPVHSITLYDQMWPEDGDQFAEAQANAQLIASAPRLRDDREGLLRALKWIISEVESEFECLCEIDGQGNHAGNCPVQAGHRAIADAERE